LLPRPERCCFGNFHDRAGRVAGGIAHRRRRTFPFFWDTLLPLSITTIAALFVIQFIYGWNQYLWLAAESPQRTRCRPSSPAQENADHDR